MVVKWVGGEGDCVDGRKGRLFGGNRRLKKSRKTTQLPKINNRPLERHKNLDIIVLDRNGAVGCSGGRGLGGSSSGFEFEALLLPVVSVEVPRQLRVHV